MAMNIKNERVHALARRAAAVTGGTQTSALEAALEEYLERHGGPASAAEDRLERASVLVGQIRDGLDLGTGASLADEVADLYDVHGVPR